MCELLLLPRSDAHPVTREHVLEHLPNDVEVTRNERLVIVADRLGEYLNLGIEGRPARGVGVWVSRPVDPVPLILLEYVLTPPTGERLRVHGEALT